MPETSWKTLLTDRDVVMRGIRFSLVVGLVLIAINHGDALLEGDVSPGRAAQMALTMAVPYCVSVLSSAGAVRSGRVRITRD